MKHAVAAPEPKRKKCTHCGKFIRKGEKSVTFYNPLNLLISVHEMRRPDKYAHVDCEVATWVKRKKRGTA